MSTEQRWTDYAICLDGSLYAPVSCEAEARDYPYGVLVCRPVRVTAIPNCGDAVVAIGEWQILQRHEKAS